MVQSKKVIVSVSNDLVSDQRVHKTCITLIENGWEVLLVGRKLPNSLALNPRPYSCKRMNLLFTKGALFYAEFNFRLFLFLLFHRAKVLHSNDLDTLLANYLVSKIKGSHLVYDSHEYFTEVPELVNRPKVQKIWERIEGLIFPKLQHVFTVNESIAELYRNKYRVNVKVLRNVPRLNSTTHPLATSLDFGGRKILLLQGAGINIQRGAEELVEAMQYIVDAVLLVVGSGDVLPMLKQQTLALNLSDRVYFLDKMPFEKLQNITRQATLGFSMDKATNINYQLSLPNKLFDYIHAGLPVVASNLKEVSNIVLNYNVGMILPNHEPIIIAEKISELLENNSLLNEFKINCLKAALELNWENEEKKLISTYSSLLEK